MTIAIPRLDRSTAAGRGLTIADFLVPIRIGERLSSRVRHIALIVLGALVVAACARIYIPIQPVPFTGQTLGVLVVGGALGFRRGGGAMLLYLAMGALGVPVFAQGTAGSAILVGASGGYLVGFVVAAAVVGRLAELGWDRRLGGALGAVAIGSVIIYAIGVPWLKVVTGMSWAEAIDKGMLRFLVWDGAKVLIAAVVFPAVWWLVERRPDDR